MDYYYTLGVVEHHTEGGRQPSTRARVFLREEGVISFVR